MASIWSLEEWQVFTTSSKAIVSDFHCSIDLSSHIFSKTYLYIKILKLIIFSYSDKSPCPKKQEEGSMEGRRYVLGTCSCGIKKHVHKESMGVLWNTTIQHSRLKNKKNKI